MSKARKAVVPGIFAAVLLIWFVFTFVLEAACAVGTSMLPTCGEFVIEIAFRRGVPEPGDIVFIQSAALGYRITKRIIADENDTIAIADGQTYINGEKIREEYVQYPGGSDYGCQTVPEHHVFVMGDNRAASWDSRYAEIGFIDKDEITGVVFAVFPLQDVPKLAAAVWIAVFLLRRFWKNTAVLRCIAGAVETVLIAAVLSSLLLTGAYSSDVGMRPAYGGSTTYFALRWVKPKSGSLVLIQALDRKIVRRVIALENDTVAVTDGQTYVNGEKILENYVVYPGGPDFERQTVPEHHVFVMGDNRANSWDSRYPEIGFVDEDEIMGVVFFGYSLSQ